MKRPRPFNLFIWIASGLTVLAFVVAMWFILSSGSPIDIPTEQNGSTSQTSTSTTDDGAGNTTTTTTTSTQTPQTQSPVVKDNGGETNTPPTEEQNTIEKLVTPIIDGVKDLVTIKIGG